MMAVPVNILVLDQSNAPVLGAVVGVYDPATLGELGLTLTNPQGIAAFLLEPGTYEVRGQKLLHRFGSPEAIQVDAELPNIFEMRCVRITPPVATDPRCCRVSGRFFGLNNQPIAGATVRFMAKTDAGEQVPKVVDGNMISAEGLALQTDQNGRVETDLIRGAELYVTFSGDDDQVWNIKVPNTPSANLIELIHPTPKSLAWSQADAPGNSVSIPVGDGALIPFTVTFTDLITRTSGLSPWVKFTSSDEAVARLDQSDGRLLIRAVSVGVATVQAHRVTGVFPVAVPEEEIEAPLLQVAVTP